MTLINQQCLNYTSLQFVLLLQSFNSLQFTRKRWCRCILIYKCATNCNILQASHYNFPCIFDNISVTNIDLTFLIWRTFSILLRNSASINIHANSEPGTTRPPMGRSRYWLAAMNHMERVCFI